MMKNEKILGADAAEVDAAERSEPASPAPHDDPELVIECGPGGAEHALRFARAHGLEVAGLTDRFANCVYAPRIEHAFSDLRAVTLRGGHADEDVHAYHQARHVLLNAILSHYFTTAPELVDALKYVVNCFDRESCDPMLTLDPVQAIALAKSAIAKAEGRS